MIRRVLGTISTLFIIALVVTLAVYVFALNSSTVFERRSPASVSDQ